MTIAITAEAVARPVRVPERIEPERRAVHVVRMDAERDPRWTAYIDRHPDTTVYHHPLWLRTIADTYGHRPVALACAGEDGALRGVLPLMRTHGLLNGARLSSLPHTPVAGPLADGEAENAALLSAAVAIAGRHKGTVLQVKAADADLDAVEGRLTPVPWEETYVRELPPSASMLRLGNSRNHARIRWAVNKAERAGVRVRMALDLDDLRAWYGLYLETMRHHAVPPRPYHFFRTAWKHLRPPGLMRLLLAEQHDAMGGRPRLLAGSVFLGYGSTLHYAFNGRRADALDLRPNDLIQWRALHDAANDGFRWYDFGEVADGNRGLADFKSKWGARPRRLTRYYAPAPREAESGLLGPDAAPRRVLAALWRRTPLPVTHYAGAVLYRYL